MMRFKADVLFHRNDAADQWFKDLNTRTDSVVSARRRSNDRKVKVAILDTGINEDSPGIADYKRQILIRKDFTRSTVGTADEVGHGTNAAALLFKVAPQAVLCVAKVVASRTATELTTKHIAEVCPLFLMSRWQLTRPQGYHMGRRYLECRHNHNVFWFPPRIR
jgi:subtilisin family serine protease